LVSIQQVSGARLLARGNCILLKEFARSQLYIFIQHRKLGPLARKTFGSDSQVKDNRPCRDVKPTVAGMMYRGPPGRNSAVN